MSDKFEQVIKQGWESWANKWDKENPNKHVEDCNKTKALQENARYLREQREKTYKQYTEVSKETKLSKDK